jgi:hypothetical protein
MSRQGCVPTPLPLRIASAYAFLLAAILFAFGMLVLMHVRSDPDRDGNWQIPAAIAGCTAVGVLVRLPSLRAWLAVLSAATAAAVFGVPSRLAGLTLGVILFLPSTLYHVGLLHRRDCDR